MAVKNLEREREKCFAANKGVPVPGVRALKRFGTCLSGSSTIQATKDGALHYAEVEWTKKEKEIKDILRKLDQLMPNVTFKDVKTTTSAKNSQAAILNHKEAYCVGDHLRVRLDAYDHLGQRKVYGGDFLRARISSPSLKAGASGLIQDLRNGSYLVDFTLPWEGNASVSLLLIHPSEAVSALWAARKKGYDKIAFTGRFLSGTSEVSAECGFHLSQSLGLCAYVDERDQEAFYCVKPKKVPCEAFVRLKSHNTAISYLTELERSLLTRSNIGMEIPHELGEIPVVLCERNNTITTKTCWMGAESPFPSGFVWQDQWHPLFCPMASFNTGDEIKTCLGGKLVYFMGDSTVRQWMENLKERGKTLIYLDAHVSGKPQKLMAIDVAENIQLYWKKHGHPYIGSNEYTVKDHTYIAQDIDKVAGDKNTVIVISLGQHFRPFPIEFFICRALHVRAAIQRLLLRSPDTRVIIKGENTREMNIDQEQFSDFHGYSQYLALKYIFQGLNVGFIDTWDMTVAFNTNHVHPPNYVIENEVNMLLNYIC
ncbi:hypothetical protein JRQ81_010746 [Phrynocephalus forsythii]|uniref:NXPE C-terminal domain-containing protein n=1 Tax=Phrynocephalus forsythii TaxID=171643 RepID=A0A9Q1AR47_9SAUR|nr:hypothetical protein JRQ81_010746 [Phrynocephalus forsythii]